VIKIDIRKESYFIPEIFSNLMNTAMKVARKIEDAEIPIKDDTVIIWLKKFEKGGMANIYPKIEIDSKDQELQFDLDLDGNLREIHFKRFVQRQDGTWERVDIDKKDADQVLQLVYSTIISI